MVPVWRLCPVIVRHHVIDFDLVLFHQVCRQRGCAFDGLFEVSVLIDTNLYSDADLVAPSGEICMIALLVRREVLNVASRSDNRSSTVPPPYEAVRPVDVGGSQVPWTSLFGRRVEARNSAEGIMPQAGGFGNQVDDLSRYVREPDAPRLTQDAAKPGAARDVPQAAQSLYAITSREGAPRARDSGATGTTASAMGRQPGRARDRAAIPHDTPEVSAAIQGLQTPVTSSEAGVHPAPSVGHVLFKFPEIQVGPP